MAKYGKKAAKTVESAMHRRKKGTLKSGSGQTVRSRKQAIAIGLSEAREKGAKVPEPPARSGGRKTSGRASKGSSANAGRSSRKTTGSSRKTSSSSRSGSSTARKRGAAKKR